MTALSNPFGFRVVQHLSGIARPNPTYKIASGLNETLCIGTPMALNATGTVQTASTTEQKSIGVFAGCSFTLTGRNQVSNVWPAATVSPDALAVIYDEPNIILEAQANGPITQAHVGQYVNAVNPTSGNATIGQSFAGVGTTTATTGTFEVMGVAPIPSNALGDAFTVVRLKYALHALK